MGTSTYLCLNGEFLKESEPRFFPGNRAFRFGEALSENIHAFATDLQFLDLHLQRLRSSMNLLAMEIPAFINEQNIRQLSASLLNRNKIFGGAVIRLTVFREDGNYYESTDNPVTFLLESRSLQLGKYVLNDRGLLAGISDKYIKTPGTFAPIHRANAFLYTMAAFECRQRKLDAIILLNTQGRMVETADSNLFLVKGQHLFTPGINQGCISGIMRNVLIRLATEVGLNVNDQSSLTPAAMQDADEVFITNATDGIRWIGAWENIRYFNKTARLLMTKLNEAVFK